MNKTKVYAIVTGRLLIVTVLLLVRWVCEPFYFIFLILYSSFETIRTGFATLINHLKSLNDELFAANKQ
jgi:hypothetical protein